MRSASRTEAWRSDAGFTLIEMVVSFSLLAIVILALAGTVAVGFDLVGKSKVNQIAATLGNAEVERIRALRDQSAESGEAAVFTGGYDAIGTLGGNPPGQLEAERTETVRGVEFTIKIAVSFIEDQLPGQNVNYAASKLVVVTVAPTTAAGGKEMTFKTVIAPETSATPATVIFNVWDAGSGGSTAVSGVGVRLAEGGFNIKQDFTDANGTATFAGLEPGVTYDVEVADLNWPASLASCDSATVTPNALDAVTVNCYVTKALTLQIDVTDSVSGATPAADYELAVWLEGNGYIPTTGELFQSNGSPLAPTPPSVTWTLTDLGGTTMRQNVTYHVAAWAPGYAPVWTSFNPGYPTGGTASAALALAPASQGGAVALTVEQGSAPVNTARVIVTQGGTEVVKFAVTTAGGQVTINLEPGTYDVVADSNGAQSPVQTVTVVDAQTEFYTLTLPGP